jgi:GntR family transcriptional repressor for pyruvate dehydrogenase complex
MFEQVHSQRYYMQIVNQIRELIVQGRLKSGDRLPSERNLAQEFGTSRASIREALSALEMLGLVESKSGYGNIIRSDGAEDSIGGELLRELLKAHRPYEIFESRLEIEPTLAALAAERATEQEKKKMLEQVETLNELGKKIQGDPGKRDQYMEEYMEEDRKLHLMIGRSAHNNLLFMVFSGVNLMMKEAHWKTLKAKAVGIEGNLERYGKDHRAIISAIREGKPGFARAKMRRHIDYLKGDLFDE